MASDPLQRSTPKVDLRADGSPWGGMVTALALAGILLLGIQLGGIPWRYRRNLLQLQGGLVGLAVGFVAGRLTASRSPR